MKKVFVDISHTGHKRKAASIGGGAGEADNMAMSATERALNLFQALDINDDGLLTMEEFIAGYMERNVLQAKQDAQEQRQHKDWLSFRGTGKSVSRCVYCKSVYDKGIEMLLLQRKASVNVCKNYARVYDD